MTDRPAAASGAVALALAVTGLCLLAYAGGEALQAALRYERAAVLEQGQWWRLISGQFAHLGAGHLLGNLAAWLLMVWLCVPVLGVRGILTVGVGGLLGTALGLLLLTPSVLWYAGLSGALHGLAAGAATRLASRRALVGGLLLAAVATKVAAETWFGGLPGTPALPDGARVVTEAHLWGGAGGVLAALVMAGVERLRGR